MVAGHPTKGKGGVPLPLGLAIWKVLELGSYSKTLGKPLGIHLYNEGEREGAGHTLAAPPLPPQRRAPQPPPLPNPSRPPPHTPPAVFRRSPAGVLHHHRHHAVVLSGFRGGSTTSAARWNGEEDIVINTERVTEWSGTVKIFYALLQAASDRLHPPRDLISLMLCDLQGYVDLHLVATIFLIGSWLVVHHGVPSINFNQFLEKEKLKSNGSNFTDWFRHCAILCSLEAELQKRFEHHDPYELVHELKAIFETHAAVESYEASKHFFGCMMEEGSSVSEHVPAMSGHAKKLSDLGIVIPNKLGIHRVLQSLPSSYKNFVMNYNMQNMNKELPELFSMLKSTEVEIQKEHQVLMVNKTTSFKKQGKPNKKGNFKKGSKKVAAPPEKPKAGPKPDTECYYCKEEGHWKRNCPKYMADLKSGLVKKKKVTDASWNTDPDDSKSQSGYVFILNGAAVSWMSSKQCTVAKSSTESEYIAASEASSEAVWMKRFIVELGVVPSALDPLVIYCDNMGAIANAQEPRSHKKLKHIKLCFIRFASTSKMVK
ncbi:hypothetical protein QYE76_007501 [Lolium multiflorum]|uniref:CCHC-type domain-containing protein n=1 Tax=Lolium multiflorum TaxID=4521 RepID=A0AAD8RWZ7_LOLMU|nr:hypothetical protein QYE76_007501 [Lolium multiflorum]